MGREVRMVPPGWKHPKVMSDYSGHMDYKGLMKGPYSQRVAEWDEANAKWQEGLRESWSPSGSTWIPIEPEFLEGGFEGWDGPRPLAEDYMPEWADGEATMLVMYENTSEGTPISPAFHTPEELARWLADTGASAFADMTASYEDWLATCKAGWSAGMIITNKGEHISGVAANNI